MKIEDMAAEIEELKRDVWRIVKISPGTKYELFDEQLMKLPIAKSVAHLVATINVIMEGVFRSTKAGTNTIYGTTLKHLDKAVSAGSPLALDPIDKVSESTLDFHNLVLERIQWYFNTAKATWSEAYIRKGNDLAVVKGIGRLTGITRLLVGIVKPDETRSKKFLTDETILKYCQEIIPDATHGGSLSVLELFKAECLYDLLRAYCDKNRGDPAQLQLTGSFLESLQTFFGVKTKLADEGEDDVWEKLNLFKELIAKRKDKIPQRLFDMTYNEPFPAPVIKFSAVCTVLKNRGNIPKNVHKEPLTPEKIAQYAIAFEEEVKLYRLRQLNGAYRQALAKKSFASYTAANRPLFHNCKWLMKNGTPEQSTRATVLRATVADALGKPKDSKRIRESFNEYYGIVKEAIEQKMRQLVEGFPKDIRDEILEKAFRASIGINVELSFML